MNVVATETVQLFEFHLELTRSIDRSTYGELEEVRKMVYLFLFRRRFTYIHVRQSLPTQVIKHCRLDEKMPPNSFVGYGSSLVPWGLFVNLFLKNKKHDRVWLDVNASPTTVRFYHDRLTYERDRLVYIEIKLE